MRVLCNNSISLSSWTTILWSTESHCTEHHSGEQRKCYHRVLLPQTLASTTLRQEYTISLPAPPYRNNSNSRYNSGTWVTRVYCIGDKDVEAPLKGWRCGSNFCARNLNLSHARISLQPDSSHKVHVLILRISTVAYIFDQIDMSPSDYMPVRYCMYYHNPH